MFLIAPDTAQQPTYRPLVVMSAFLEADDIKIFSPNRSYLEQLRSQKYIILNGEHEDLAVDPWLLQADPAVAFNATIKAILEADGTLNVSKLPEGAKAAFGPMLRRSGANDSSLATVNLSVPIFMYDEDRLINVADFKVPLGKETKEAIIRTAKTADDPIGRIDGQISSVRIFEPGATIVNTMVYFERLLPLWNAYMKPYREAAQQINSLITTVGRTEFDKAFPSLRNGSRFGLNALSPGERTTFLQTYGDNRLPVGSEIDLVRQRPRFSVSIGSKSDPKSGGKFDLPIIRS